MEVSEPPCSFSFFHKYAVDILRVPSRQCYSDFICCSLGPVGMRVPDFIQQSTRVPCQVFDDSTLVGAQRDVGNRCHHCCVSTLFPTKTLWKIIARVVDMTGIEKRC